MNPPIENSLLITAIGMGLVFISILLLWGMMELVVRMTANKRSPLEQPDKAKENTKPAQTADNSDQTNRAKAAAAAVSYALAIEKTARNQQTVQAPRENISTWQAVMRAGNLNQISNFQRRNPKGSRS